jgi:hypothetical protein
VDHKIEDYVDIERTRGEGAEAVNLEEHRLRDERKRRANGGIEAL